ncbi:MAG: fructokinase [Firmicutes bacterium HGW-Firmicutes-3]|jgi:fructokinase|nr:MAG: fructokinase [Firmicutes bacterium HGW-Firmicutes-3]
MKKLLGAIEAGGTKFVCAVADENLNIIDKMTTPTLEPERTLEESIAFFKKYKIQKLGIGTFGPIDIHPESPDYGMIQNTPKIKWRGINLYKTFYEALEIPVKIDTDVNAAALGEYRHGYGIGKRSVLYITIGTGIGAGFVIEGETLYGLTHPEMGHITIKQKKDDTFKGICPTHGNCFEGLVSGPAIEARIGKRGPLISENNSVWELNADYIGQALVSYNLILSPEIILIGGGVSQQEHMFPKIREAFKRYMNGYVMHQALENLDTYIRYPKNGQDAGLVGSLELALRA